MSGEIFPKCPHCELILAPGETCSCRTKPRCRGCRQELQREWLLCPQCGTNTGSYQNVHSSDLLSTGKPIRGIRRRDAVEEVTDQQRDEVDGQQDDDEQSSGQLLHKPNDNSGLKNSKVKFKPTGDGQGSTGKPTIAAKPDKIKTVKNSQALGHLKFNTFSTNIDKRDVTNYKLHPSIADVNSLSAQSSHACSTGHLHELHAGMRTGDFSNIRHSVAITQEELYPHSGPSSYQPALRGNYSPAVSGMTVNTFVDQRVAHSKFATIYPYSPDSQDIDDEEFDDSDERSDDKLSEGTGLQLKPEIHSSRQVEVQFDNTSENSLELEGQDRVAMWNNSVHSMGELNEATDTFSMKNIIEKIKKGVDVYDAIVIAKHIPQCTSVRELITVALWHQNIKLSCFCFYTAAKLIENPGICDNMDSMVLTEVDIWNNNENVKEETWDNGDRFAVDGWLGTMFLQFYHNLLLQIKLACILGRIKRLDGFNIVNKREDGIKRLRQQLKTKYPHLERQVEYNSYFILTILRDMNDTEMLKQQLEKLNGEIQSFHTEPQHASVPNRNTLSVYSKLNTGHMHVILRYVMNEAVGHVSLRKLANEMAVRYTQSKKMSSFKQTTSKQEIIHRIVDAVSGLSNVLSKTAEDSKYIINENQTFCTLLRNFKSKFRYQGDIYPHLISEISHLLFHRLPIVRCFIAKELFVESNVLTERPIPKSIKWIRSVTSRMARMNMMKYLAELNELHSDDPHYLYFEGSVENVKHAKVKVACGRDITSFRDSKYTDPLLRQTELLLMFSKDKHSEKFASVIACLCTPMNPPVLGVSIEEPSINLSDYLLRYLLDGRDKLLPIETRAYIANSIIEIIEYCHSASVLLKGFTAADFTYCPEKKLVKLTDICLAVRVNMRSSNFGEEYDTLRKTGNKSDRLPILWVAPEVLLRAEHSIASEIFCLGQVINEVLSHGLHPYQDNQNYELASLVRKILKYQHLPERRPGVPENLYVAILKCLHHDPQKRIFMKKLKDEVKSYVRTDTSENAEYTCSGIEYLTKLGKKTRETSVLREPPEFLAEVHSSTELWSKDEITLEGQYLDTFQSGKSPRSALSQEDLKSHDDPCRHDVNKYRVCLIKKLHDNEQSERNRILDLDHKNVCKVTRFVKATMVDCNAKHSYNPWRMEYDIGGTHTNMLEHYTGKWVDNDVRLKHYKQIAQGLSYLHANGFIHAALQTKFLYLVENLSTVKIGHLGRMSRLVRNSWDDNLSQSLIYPYKTTPINTIRFQPDDLLSMYSDSAMFGYALWQLECANHVGRDPETDELSFDVNKTLMPYYYLHYNKVRDAQRNGIILPKPRQEYADLYEQIHPLIKKCTGFPACTRPLTDEIIEELDKVTAQQTPDDTQPNVVTLERIRSTRKTENVKEVSAVLYEENCKHTKIREEKIKETMAILPKRTAKIPIKDRIKQTFKIKNFIKSKSPKSNIRQPMNFSTPAKLQNADYVNSEYLSGLCNNPMYADSDTRTDFHIPPHDTKRWPKPRSNNNPATSEYSSTVYEVMPDGSESDVDNENQVPYQNVKCVEEQHQGDAYDYVNNKPIAESRSVSIAISNTTVQESNANSNIEINKNDWKKKTLPTQNKTYVEMDVKTYRNPTEVIKTMSKKEANTLVSEDMPTLAKMYPANRESYITVLDSGHINKPAVHFNMTTQLHSHVPDDTPDTEISKF